jgi:hypothetical protein
VNHRNLGRHVSQAIKAGKSRMTFLSPVLAIVESKRLQESAQIP